jgi:hypothetical protein
MRFPVAVMRLMLLSVLLAHGRDAGAAAEGAATAPRIPGHLAADLPRLGRTNYVGSDACRECHREEHASWHRSYHRTMTQAAQPETVLGNFDGTAVVSEGLTYRLSKTPEGLKAEMPDPDVMMYVVQGGRRDRW